MTRYTNAFTYTNTTDLGTDFSLISAAAAPRFSATGTAAKSGTTSVAVAMLLPQFGPATADQFAAVTLPSNTGASTAVGVRLANPSGSVVTGYVLRLTATAMALQRLNADGTTTTLSTDVAHTRIVNERIAITAVGTTITGYVAGTQVLQVTDSAFTGGRTGFRNSGTTNVTYDDFDAGDMPADAAGVNGIPQTSPTTAPGQVVGVTIGTVTATSIAVSWTATTDATAYTVEYRASGASSWTALSATAATSATITGLASSTTYEIRVTASNGVGAGTPSSTATAATAAPSSTPPGQTVGLVAGTATTTSVPLSWTATATATAYLVEYRVAGVEDWSSPGLVETTSATIPDLSPGTPYEFRITPYNAAGAGTPSATASRTTAAAAGTPVVTENQPRLGGLPAYRGLIKNLAGEYIFEGEVAHRLHTEFYGPPSAWTDSRDWIVATGGAVLSSSLGIVLKLTTDATVGAVATLGLKLPVTTTQLAGVRIDLTQVQFSAANAKADFRLFAGAGNVGASALHLASAPTAYLCSQGELNRTVTEQAIVGEDSARRRDLGLWVNFTTREAWLMEGDAVVGYRDCASTWTDGVAQVGLSITATAAAVAEVRLASMTITTYVP